MKSPRSVRSVFRNLGNRRCKTLINASRLQAKKIFRFLLLPTKVRTIVYRLLLHTEQELGSIIYGPATRRFTTSVTNLLLLCRLIHDEASPVLYGENVFWYILDAISSKPFGHVDHPPHYMRHVSLVTIDVKVADSRLLNEDERIHHISLLQKSAERMSQLLTSVNTIRKVTLSVEFKSRDEDEAHEQEALMLEIFGKVRGVRNVVILGNGPAQYKQQLKEAMETRAKINLW
ncbi:MAG: hypothetical protein M1830_004626 [Pleopsidium flavum]|nr:MAG: hypothetical protein M1830_004626 [Pleopsidium flavum]